MTYLRPPRRELSGFWDSLISTDKKIISFFTGGSSSSADAETQRALAERDRIAKEAAAAKVARDAAAAAAEHGGIAIPGAAPGTTTTSSYFTDAINAGAAAANAAVDMPSLIIPIGAAVAASALFLVLIKKGKRR